MFHQMEKIQLIPIKKAELYKILNGIPTLIVRRAMHKAQGEQNKKRHTLFPKEVELTLIELGLENLIKSE